VSVTQFTESLTVTTHQTRQQTMSAARRGEASRIWIISYRRPSTSCRV